MEQRPSVWQVAIGTMIGNIGCLILNVLVACVMFAVLSVVTPGLVDAIQRSVR